MRLLFLLIINLCIFHFSLFASDSRDTLFTAEEKEYIKTHKNVKIAMLNNFKPFSFVENNLHQGMSKDILNKISSISGLEFSIELSQWTEALHKFKEKKVDMISGISHTKEREEFSLFSKPFYEIPTYLFGLKSNDKYTGLESLKGKKVGVSKSIFYVNELKQHGIDVVEVTGSDEKVRQMALGNMDYFLASYTSGTKAVKKAAITSIKPIAEFTSIKKEDLRFGIIKEKPLLHSIIQKSILQISSQKYEKIIDKWIMNLDVRDQISDMQQKFFALFTKDELVYLKSKKSISYCIDPDWMPFEAYRNHIHTGISMDYKDIFEDKLSIPFTLVKTNSWEQSIEYAKEGKCEILSFLAMKTPKREEYLSFSTSYLRVPFVIATKNDVNFIADLALLEGKKVAMPKGYASVDLLKEMYPNLIMVIAKNSEDTLDMVAKGEVFGAIGTLASIGYLLQNKYLGELKIAGKFEHHWELSIASQKNDPILHSILEKTLASIDLSTRTDIYNRWVSVKYEQKVDYNKIWQVIIIALLAIIVVLYWNRKLENFNKELKKQQKITKQALMVKSNFLANISHEIRTPMNSIVNMTYLAKELSDNEKQKNYLDKIDIAANTLLELINNVLDISKIDAGKTNIIQSEFSFDMIKRNIESIVTTKAMENNIEFTMIIEDGVPMHLIGDGLRIEQVLINLVSNGIKFTDNGKVTVTISELKSGQYQFCVSDTGIGMNKEQLEKIFEPFTQADDTTTRNYGGTGLGLTISKELIHLMNGEMWVTSEIGKGSEFYFVLPLQKVQKEGDDTKLEKRSTLNLKETIIHNKDFKKNIVSLSYEQELFQKLKKALQSKRPNICKPLLDELDNCKLQMMDEEKFETLKNLIHRYKFVEASELIDE